LTAATLIIHSDDDQIVLIALHQGLTTELLAAPALRKESSI
jgi:hypothetical protein